MPFCLTLFQTHTTMDYPRIVNIWNCFMPEVLSFGVQLHHPPYFKHFKLVISFSLLTASAMNEASFLSSVLLSWRHVNLDAQQVFQIQQAHGEILCDTIVHRKNSLQKSAPLCDVHISLHNITTLLVE